MAILRQVFAIFSGTSVTVGFVSLVRSGWRRTVGRRQQARSRIGRITPGVRIGYVETLLGPARSKTEKDGWVEWVAVPSPTGF